MKMNINKGLGVHFSTVFCDNIIQINITFTTLIFRNDIWKMILDWKTLHTEMLYENQS